MRFVRILLDGALLAASIAFAGGRWIISGRVVGVSDGDTSTVLDHAKWQHKVRINGIDAPEKGQTACPDSTDRDLPTETFCVPVEVL